MGTTDFTQRSAPGQVMQQSMPPPAPPPASPYAQPSLSPPAPPGMQMRAAKPGLFRAMPCPHCGMKMAWETSHSHSAMRWFGVVGILLIYPLTAHYVCPQHGLVEESSFPPGHKSVATMRKVLSVGAGLGLLGAAIWVLTLLQ